MQNEIPMASGLGSSAAATVAGVVLGFSVAGRAVPKEAALQYAAEVEGHTDNVAASLLGGLVVTFTRDDGSIIGVQKRWPKMIRAVAVTPLFELATKKSRAVLPKTVDRTDAVHNLQRSALLVAALEERRYDLIWDALQDRLHQTYRAGADSRPRRRFWRCRKCPGFSESRSAARGRASSRWRQTASTRSARKSRAVSNGTDSRRRFKCWK